MSVISFPRRVDTRRGRRPIATTRPRPVRAPVEERQRWRSSSSSRRAVVTLAVAMAISLAGSMWVANRQIEIHTLQSELVQEQSNYAVQVGSLTNLAAPSQIATKAGALHLVDPVSITQIPTTSLDKPLPLPKFNGYAPATSRTSR
ncbi:MAG TPA: hypothetical protein PLG60_00900 [Acidimicrobiales bacterium]|nr:MAG: hypothetical protein B7X07_00815 [Actinobacteria bacterium 21-64-8]HQT99041.1 hypothetical protein [Acidimicrobiales bacterium]